MVRNWRRAVYSHTDRERQLPSIGEISSGSAAPRGSVGIHVDARNKSGHDVIRVSPISRDSALHHVARAQIGDRRLVVAELRSTSSVCWPRSGVGRNSAGSGVRVMLIAWPTTLSAPEPGMLQRPRHFEMLRPAGRRRSGRSCRAGRTARRPRSSIRPNRRRGACLVISAIISLSTLRFFERAGPVL